MSHVAFHSTPLELEADYVVVGSGPGGATAAVELARGGAHVALVEAGPWRRLSDYPHSMEGAFRDMMDAWGTTLTRGRALWPVVQARVMGGGTAINSAIIVRTPPDIFAQWEREHGITGIESRIGTIQDELDDELGVVESTASALGRSNELAVEAAAALQIDAHLTRRSAAKCTGAGQCLQGCALGHKCSTDLTFVPEVLQHGGEVLSNAPVQRVLLEGGRATGVTGRFVHPDTRRKGARFTVRARRAVVVAASATHSPALLQRSGLRASALGQGFRSHPGTAITGVHDDPVDMNVGVTQGWASMAFRDDPGYKLETLSLPPDLVAGRLMGGGSTLTRRLGDYRNLAVWVMGTRAESVGTVRSGLGGRPVVRYTMGRPDMERMRHAAWTLARMHFAVGARAVIPGVAGMPYSIGPGEVDRMLEASLDPRSWIAILSHLFGGCTMGTDPATAVTDVSGRVYGVDGLVVADASVIPTNLGCNPQHTIMALARLFARDLLGG